MTLLRLGDELFSEFLAFLVLGLADAAFREQIIGKVRGGIAVLFGDAVALEDFREGGENDFHIAQKGDALDVLEVVRNLRFPGDGVAPVNLCETAEALAHGVAATLLGGHEDHVANELRPRPDYGHVALQNIEEFREFVEARAAQELAVPGEAHVIGEQITLGVAGVRHGAELHELEYAFVLAGARLREEGVPTHLDDAKNREYNEDRAQADDGCQSAEEVQDTFKEVPVHQSRTSQWLISSPNSVKRYF